MRRRKGEAGRQKARASRRETGTIANMPVSPGHVRHRRGACRGQIAERTGRYAESADGLADRIV